MGGNDGVNVTEDIVEFADRLKLYDFVWSERVCFFLVEEELHSLTEFFSEFEESQIINPLNADAFREKSRGFDGGRGLDESSTLLK